MGTSSLRMAFRGKAGKGRDACFTILTKKEFLEGQIQGEKSIPFKDESLDHKYPSHSTAYACWRILPEAYLLNH